MQAAMAARVLALVSGEAEPCGPRRLEGRAVQHRIDPPFGRVHADADDPFDAGGSGTPQPGEQVDQLEPRGRPERPVHVRDQQAADAGLRFGRGQAVVQPGDDGREVLAAGKVAGRGEERLPMNQPVGSAVNDTLVGQPSPVLSAGEGRLHPPEHTKEPVERVVAVQLGRIRSSQVHAVTAGKLNQRPRAHRALNVTMQLYLRQAIRGDIKRRHEALSHHPSRPECSLSTPWLATPRARGGTLTGQPR